MLKIFKGSDDLSLSLENYILDDATVELLTTDSIDVGYFKPINSLFIELTAQVIANKIEIEFWNGSSWSVVETIDKTNGLTRSGFISWERNLDTQTETTLHGKVLYWYRLKVLTNDIPALELKGINLVFSDDTDLKSAYPDVMEYLHDGQTSFISYHQSARDFIINYLRNKGKTVSKYGVYKMLDQFDLHNYEEMKQASKYKAMAMIFFNESDAVDDKWYQKAKDFDRLYGEAISMDFLSIDANNDGKVDESENQSVQFVKIMRL